MKHKNRKQLDMTNQSIDIDMSIEENNDESTFCSNVYQASVSATQEYKKEDDMATSELDIFGS